LLAIDALHVVRPETGAAFDFRINSMTSPMKKTYSQIVEEIQTLEKKAQALKAREAQLAIAQIKKTIADFGFTAEDLGLTGRKAKRGRPAAAAKRGPGRPRGTGARVKSQIVKYRDDQGNAWSGRGRRPQWIKDAIDAGKPLESMAV
jgi:DNA-binding protein H-NS